MIWKYGDIIDSGANVIYVPVNCVGTMGAGLAKQVALAYPEVEAEYKTLCRLGLIYPKGPLHGYVISQQPYKQFMFAPTKYHWRNKASYVYVQHIIEDVADSAQTNYGMVFAVPALGCGLGGLKWDHVFRIMQDSLRNFDNVWVYGPR